MKIYFVRHAESLHNAAGIFQPGTVSLSEKGIQQARFVADRFKDIPVEKIISSDFERTKQTAEEISKAINKPVMYTELARERKTPSQIHGKSITDPDAKKIKSLVDANFGNKDFRYSDEENFHDLKARAIKLLEFLTKQPEERILVVLHGTILRCVIALMMFGEALSAEEFSHFTFFYLENTGITVCERIEAKWKLISWNDNAHLR